MHIVFQLHDVLRFDSTVFINVLINISCITKVKHPIFLFQNIECMNLFLG